MPNEGVPMSNHPPRELRHEAEDEAHSELCRLKALIDGAVTASWAWKLFSDLEVVRVRDSARRLADLMDRGAYQERVIGGADSPDDFGGGEYPPAAVPFSESPF